MARFNPRLAKIHRNYTVEEIAFLYNVHKNTAREWIKQGLPVLDKKRPLLVLGKDLRQFLENKRSKHKKTCKEGEIYCVRCREPRQPAGRTASYRALSETQGNLIGSCPVCGIVIYRRVSLAGLTIACGDLTVKMSEGLEHIEDRDNPSQNCDFQQRG